ncbi:sodium:solute symporter family protein [Brevibacillus nitrificans]|uniref:Sodium:solute symporter family protein n=1 Tax=Brevibacillus nitrificans TaxID=651560 RepID=A0A3M8D8J7_9BACL|nr:sodium:solute symporter family protein [Brevibacillus nitrificans]RNB83687.1 sodium:solute symporter family protein [Brevibacillus nitrificans]
MNMSLLMILLFFLLSLYLGFRARKGKQMNFEQWAVGGRSFGTLLVFLLMAGENFTTYTFLGASGAAYGLGGPTIYVFSALCYIVMYWVTPIVWRYGKEHRLLTQSDFFQSKYNSPALGVLAAVVGVVSMVPYLVLQLKGLGIIVSEASYGLISPTVAVWIGMLSVAFYVMVSGIHGSAWTAVIKDIVMLVVIVFVALYLPYHYYGGLKPMFQAIDAAKPGFLLVPDKGLSVSWYISTCILFAFGASMWPHMYSAIFTSRTESALRKNAALTPLYQLVLVLVLFIGFAAILQVPGLQGPDMDLALFKMAKNVFDPWFVGVIGAAGILAALVPSSLLLMAAATLLSKNVYKVWKPQTPDDQLARITRWLVPVIALICLYFTFHGGKTIITLLIMAYGFVTQLFPALVFSLQRKNVLTLQGAFCGIIAGVVVVGYVTVTNMTMDKIFPFFPQAVKDLDIGIVALIVNVVVSLVVSMATRHLDLGKRGQADAAV